MTIVADVEAKGLITLHFKSMATLLSKTKTLQEFLGFPGDALSTFDAIKQVAQEPPVRPMCLIDMQSHAISGISKGGSTVFTKGNTPTMFMRVLLEEDVADENKAKHRNAFFSISNTYGLMLEDTEKLSGQGLFQINEIRELEWSRSSRDEFKKDDYVRMAYAIG